MPVCTRHGLRRRSVCSGSMVITPPMIRTTCEHSYLRPCTSPYGVNATQRQRLIWYPTMNEWRSTKTVPGLISVPMCVYNGETYLAEAIDSVLRQTYRPIELILVDDGSTDRSGEIARGYGDRLTYIHQTHAGVGIARNRGLTASRGEFVAIQDADDIWVPE